jgi:hypothetical protein
MATDDGRRIEAAIRTQIQDILLCQIAEALRRLEDRMAAQEARLAASRAFADGCPDARDPRPDRLN